MHRGEGSTHGMQAPMWGLSAGECSTIRDAAAAQLRPGGLQRTALGRERQGTTLLTVADAACIFFTFRQKCTLFTLRCCSCTVPTRRAALHRSRALELEPQQKHGFCACRSELPRDAAAAHLRPGAVQRTALGLKNLNPSERSPFFLSRQGRTLHFPRCRSCTAPGRRTATRGSPGPVAFWNIPYFSPSVKVTQPTPASVTHRYSNKSY